MFKYLALLLMSGDNILASLKETSDSSDSIDVSLDFMCRSSLYHALKCSCEAFRGNSTVMHRLPACARSP